MGNADFRVDGKAMLHDTIVEDSWYYAFVKTHKILQHKFLMYKN